MAENGSGWTYTFRDALRGGPSPCPACAGEGTHAAECPIKERKRRYFMLVFGPPLLTLLAWDLVVNGIGSLLEGVIPGLIGCSLAGVSGAWWARRRKR